MVRADGSASGQAQVFRQTLGQSARTRRAFVGFGICWALAIVSILIPVAHFVLVPGFALAGPIVAWLRFRQQRIILGGLLTCPSCGAFTLLKSCADDWPLTLYCSSCRAGLDVEQPPTD